MRKLTLAEIIKKLRKYNPREPSDLLIACNLPLQLINWGAFRQVFDVIGTGYVIKTPFQEDYDGTYDSVSRDISINHSRDEYEAYKRIKDLRRTQYEPIRKYLPEMPYFHNGITLVEKCTTLDKRNKAFDKEISQIETFLKEWYADPDIGKSKRENYGIDYAGRLKILDLGCFTPDYC